MRYKSFPLWPPDPGKQTPRGALHPNPVTPMHGLFLKIFVNEPALETIQQAITQPSPPETVTFPNGSFIVKENFPFSEDPGALNNTPFLTVMFKIDGYCPEKRGIECVGGEWFWFVRRFGYFPAVGKPQDFCTNCHAPVDEADWTWTLFGQLRAQEAPITINNEFPNPHNAAGLCDNVELSNILPGDVAMDPSNLSPEDAQQMFDCLSWLSFVALNYPADPNYRGRPQEGTNITDAGNRVWESYMEVFEVFQPDNPEWNPSSLDWNSPPPEVICESGDTGDGKGLRMVTKTRSDQILNETHQAFGNQFNTLVDQKGNLVRYEVRFNQDEFHFLTRNGFATTNNYDFSGPLTSIIRRSAVKFPDNISGINRHGAIEIKAAWKQMTDDDIKSRYYIRKAVVFTPSPDPKDPSKAKCKVVDVGLIGLHIAHKTFWAPQWVWSTFEHIDNVPTEGWPSPPNGK